MPRAVNPVTILCPLLLSCLAIPGFPLAAEAQEASPPGAAGRHSPHRRLDPVPAKQVKIADAFWAPRMDIMAKSGIPHQYDMLEKTGRLENFRRAAKGEGRFQGYWFNDSDVYKWVEAAARSLIPYPDQALEEKVEGVIALIAAAQAEDGYLNTFIQLEHPDKRWANLHMAHELYCAGHLIQAALAWEEATGKKDLMAVARRFADLVCAVFGPGKRRGAPGHECIEMALVELYRRTGEQKYLDQADYFIRERGKPPYIFEGEKGQHWMPGGEFDPRYFQAHAPFTEQREAVGHCVRALYLYCGAADLFAETGDPALAKTLEALWRSVYERRCHVTGGVGAVAGIEGFGKDFELPNETAYDESCAQVAAIMWNWRMLQLAGDARYADAMERTLYNAFLSGISADGKKYFYANPLASHGQHERREWFGCACCPPNLARLLEGFGNLPYSTSKEGIWIHLYAGGSVETPFAVLEVDSKFPWFGRNIITVHPKTDQPFSIFVRKPYGCGGSFSSINGRDMELFPPGKEGYEEVRREWKDGDVLRIFFDMPTVVMRADPRVRDDLRRGAVRKGPVIYCMEEADNPCPDHEIELYSVRAHPRIRERMKSDLLGGIMTIELEGAYTNPEAWKEGLYAWKDHVMEEKWITLIPYFAWNNRGPGGMQVWIPLAPEPGGGPARKGPPPKKTPPLKLKPRPPKGGG